MTPQLRFPQFTDEWNAKTLGVIGKVAMCKRIYASETSEYGEVPFYKIGTFGRTPDAYITRAQYEEYRDKYPFPRSGDLLLSASGTIGRMVVYDGEPAYFQDSNIIWLSHDDSIVTNGFLRQVYARINWVTESGTIQRLYNDNFLKTEITVPSLPEQEKIASFFALVDDRIDKSAKRLKLLLEYKKGIMQKLFTQAIRFKNENNEAYPEWTSMPLADISYSETSPLSANQIEDRSGQFKVYGASGVLQTLDSYHYKDEYIAVVKDGAGAGRISYCEPMSSVLGTMIVIQPKEGTDKRFLYYLLHLIDFKKYTTGSTIPHVYFKQYSKEMFSIPCIKEQQKIATILTLIDDKIKVEEKNHLLTKEWKKGLAQRMFI